MTTKAVDLLKQVIMVEVENVGMTKNIDEK